MTTMPPLVNLALAGALLALAGCGMEEVDRAELREGPPVATYAIDGGRTLDVSDGFVRPVEAGAMSSAGYLSLTASAPLSIVGARSDDFTSVELHDVEMDGAIMRMRPIERIDVVPGETTQLAPGEKHLMMMAPTRTLAVGDSTTVTLILADGAEATVTLPVDRR